MVRWRRQDGAYFCNTIQSIADAAHHGGHDEPVAPISLGRRWRRGLPSVRHGRLLAVVLRRWLVVHGGGHGLGGRGGRGAGAGQGHIDLLLSEVLGAEKRDPALQRRGADVGVLQDCRGRGSRQRGDARVRGDDAGSLQLTAEVTTSSRTAIVRATGGGGWWVVGEEGAGRAQTLQSQVMPDHKLASSLAMNTGAMDGLWVVGRSVGRSVGGLMMDDESNRSQGEAHEDGVQ